MKVMNGLDLQNQKIIALGDPSNNTDAANKQYVDNVARGLYWKTPVRVATTTNLSLASGFINGSSIDGVVLATGDRILIKDQTTGSENGIYTVNVSGAPTRAIDADNGTELAPGTAVTVITGTTNGDKVFLLVSDASITIGTTPQTWGPLGGGSSTSYLAGNGINISGTTISATPKTNGGLVVDTGGLSVAVNTTGGLNTDANGVSVKLKSSGSGLIIDSNGIYVDSTIARKFSGNITAGSTSTTYTHNLGTLDISVSIIEISTGNSVITDWTASTTNTVTIAFASAPTSGQYRFVVIG